MGLLELTNAVESLEQTQEHSLRNTLKNQDKILSYRDKFLEAYNKRKELFLDVYDTRSKMGLTDIGYVASLILYVVLASPELDASIKALLKDPTMQASVRDTSINPRFIDAYNTAMASTSPLLTQEDLLAIVNAGMEKIADIEKKLAEANNAMHECIQSFTTIKNSIDMSVYPVYTTEYKEYVQKILVEFDVLYQEKV